MKHKKNRSCRHKHRERSRSRDRSCSRSYVSRRASRESPRRSPSKHSSHRSRDRLLQTLCELVEHVKRRETPSSGEVSENLQRPASLVLPENGTTFADRSGETSANMQIDDHSSNDQGGDPDNSTPLSITEGSTGVSFSNPVVTACIEERPESDSLAVELFGEQSHQAPTTSWLPVILNTTKAEVRSGLKEELRINLLAKFVPKEDLIFLEPPKINKEILPNLGATIIARDKHQTNAQAQVGAALNALGSGFSELSQLECLQAAGEGKVAITKIAEGIRLVADHFFRLSQTRRAFIVPSLNFLGKTVSDSAPIDECLFGSNFAQELNAAQSIENTARKMARKALQPSGQSSQQLPRRQGRQQQTYPVLRERRQENLRPPFRKVPSVHQSKRGPPQSNRNRRSTSRSRGRPRH